MIKNVLITTFLMVKNKMKRATEEGFRQIWKVSYDNAIDTNQESDLRYKGRMLNNLKEYPRLNLQRAFWKWYLTTTATGSQHFIRATNNLVLYTHCNKVTAFYRLLHPIRKNIQPISPAMRKKVVVMNATLKLALRKFKSDAFNAIRLAASTVRQRGALHIIDTIKLKQTKCIQIWLRNTKMKNAQYNDNSRIR